MQRRTIKKLLIIALIFTMTFANPLFVTKSIATSIFDFANKSDTGSKSIEFNAFWNSENMEMGSVISDVNNKDLKMQLKVNVKDSGYLKNAKIALMESEENAGLNFKLKNVEKETDTIETTVEEVSAESIHKETEQVTTSVEEISPIVEETTTTVEEVAPTPVSTPEPTPEPTVVEKKEEQLDISQISDSIERMENNEIILKQINGAAEAVIELPIEYENEEYIRESKLSDTVKVVFSGIYVDNAGKETEVSKEVDLTLTWKDEREVRIETEVLKYIPYTSEKGNGVILQTKVVLDSETLLKSLPIKKSELKVEVPEISSKEPSEITVLAKSTKGTNGRSNEEVEFTGNNWSYNAENKEINIVVENAKREVEVNNNPEDTLKTLEVNKEERYYSLSGKDEYIITYVYENIEVEPEVNVLSKVAGKIETFEGRNEVKSKEVEERYEYKLSGQKGEIVSAELINGTEVMPKAYSYLNYNNSKNYDILFETKNVINISNKEIVDKIRVEDTKLYYENKEGQEVETEDVKYKTIKVTKENFKEILGEEGYIKVINAEGEEIGRIDKDSNEINIEEKEITKVIIETSKPVKEGNIIINAEKIMRKSGHSKEEYIGFTKLVSENVVKAKYSYVEEREIAAGRIETRLKETETKANIEISKESLSTLKENKDVEIRVVLNNNTEESDIYGDSVFEIEMPEYIETVEITDANIVYGEGLQIEAIEPYSENGRIYIRIKVVGKQEYINSGVLTKGCNIVLNTNIKVNKFTPAVEKEIKLKYTNSEATNYANNGESVKRIKYSSPVGLIAVNAIKGYKDENTMVSSVNQGTKVDVIEANSEAKTATTEIMVMNNNNNEVSNITILGRIAYKGVKDLKTGKDLGTTVNTEMTKQIEGDAKNRGNFKVYYSGNGEADKDLNKEANRWIKAEEVGNLAQIKSYLIVAEDSNYKMKSGETLKFSYEYGIPANLGTEEQIYGTFLAEYVNEGKAGALEEIAVADKVGLTTETKVEEVGAKQPGETPTPSQTSPTPSQGNPSTTPTQTPSGVEPNPTPTQEPEKPVENARIEAEILTEAEAFDGTTGDAVVNENIDLSCYGENEERLFRIKIGNKTNKDETKVRVTVKMPEEMRYTGMTGYEGRNDEIVDGSKVEYNEQTREITWTIDKLERGQRNLYTIKTQTGELPEEITRKELTSSMAIRLEDGTEYKVESGTYTITKPSIEITQKTLTDKTYVKEGEEIEYVFSVKNVGPVTVEEVELEDELPQTLTLNKIEYTLNEETNEIEPEENGVHIVQMLQPGDEMLVNVKAVVNSLNGAKEKTVTNQATVESEKTEVQRSNAITHIVEGNGEESTKPENTNNGNAVENNSNWANNNNSSTPENTNNNKQNIVKKYQVSGVAWLDENKNGRRDSSEKRMSNVTARLVKAETGTIMKTIVTGDSGEYKFTEVEEGEYIIVYDYDTAKYGLTTYRKSDIEGKVNSDAITTQIEQDGKTRDGAVTDTIKVEGQSISEIDIGLIEPEIFDLSIEKTISKITTQNEAGTNSTEFDNKKLAKIDIAGKYIAGTVVYIEYNIKVKNEGELAGYAKKIVDYIPEGMSFNSNLNTEWYTGEDGNLYTTKLSNEEIKPGETKEVKLILTKQMTAENTGNINNNAEIKEDYNVYGVADINSKAGNKVQKENDMSAADAIITIKTGETLIYTSVVITTALLGAIVVFITYNRISIRRKGGV